MHYNKNIQGDNHMQRFPADFQWGASTAASQYEGGWNQGGRGLAMTDVMTAGKKERKVTWIDKFGNSHASPVIDFELPADAQYAILEDYDYPNHEGSDFYHHWKEDIELFGRLGLNTFLLTISWSRLFPKGTEEEPNPNGITFYRQIFEELARHNITPIVTLWHWDTPLYLAEKLGEWTDRQMIDYFVHFAKTCFVAFKGLVTRWLTFSEINGPIAQLDFDPEEFDPQVWKNAWQRTHHMLVASALAVQAGHEIDPQNEIGCVLAAEVIYPRTSDPEDFFVTRETWERENFLTADVLINGEYPAYAPKHWKAHMAIPQILDEDRDILKKGTIDFCGLTYYHSHITGRNKAKHEEVNEVLQPDRYGNIYDPAGLRTYLNALYNRYNLPVLIVENGLGTIDKEENGQIHDPYRIDFLKAHIDQVAQAIQDGIPVKGYMVWSAVDLVSNASGDRSKRYGLIYADMDHDGVRIPKDSYYWYQKVIRTNGDDTEPENKTTES